MHLSKKKEHVKFNERALRDHYEEVWRIAQEEIRRVFMRRKNNIIQILKKCMHYHLKLYQDKQL